MVLKPESPAGPRSFGRMVWSEVVLPLAVAAGLAFIAVALIEGPPLEQFLYAVF